MRKILVVDDKPSMRKMLKTNLEIEGYLVFTEKNALEASQTFKDEYDLIVSDLKMDGMSGIEFLKFLREKEVQTPFILMTAYAKIKDAVEAMKLGATDFIEKPFEMDDLLFLIKRSIKLGDDAEENHILKAFTSRSNEEINIVGNSECLRKTVSMVERVALTDSAVLLTGESGTGKEIFAKYLHYKSKRKEYPFVAINCAAIPPQLMEAELFGYEKGAFTGADSRKIGLFEIAKDGTIFLDEIGELPFEVQSKLLRVLQEKEFLRIGGVKTIKTNARVVSATNQNLQQLIDERKFRDDLFYRISVIPIVIPSLKDRKEDIPLLIEYFIDKYSKDLNLRDIKLSTQAKDVLESYNYKGNIRQLKNMIERAVILSENNTITLDSIGLTKDEIPIKESKPSFDFSEELTLQEVTDRVIREAESKHIEKILKREFWNRSNAAKKLGVSYKTLLTKIKDYNLNP
ncbi:sigma-54-dependent Fis family transcriptional regulator [bacterium]|nr:sigma-54-dependent Fis family transcriptional regulator [bacterium]